MTHSALRPLALPLALLLSTAASAGPATDAVKSGNDVLRGAIRRMVKAKGDAYEKARAEARTAVSGLLDFDALAAATLGKRWDGLKPAERARYVESMRGAMEASYLARMGGDVDVDAVKVEYLGEEAKTNGVVVKTKVAKGKDAVQIDYLVPAKAEKGKKLRAIDLFTEEVSLAETYREQINALWPKKGFDGVVAAFDKKKKRFEQELQDRSKEPREAK